jgi:hypothetical protein
VGERLRVHERFPGAVTAEPYGSKNGCGLAAPGLATQPIGNDAVALTNPGEISHQGSAWLRGLAKRQVLRYIRFARNEDKASQVLSQARHKPVFP